MQESDAVCWAAETLDVLSDVELLASRPDAGTRIVIKLRPGRHAWIQMIDGALDVNGVGLSMGDGDAVSDETALQLRTSSFSTSSER